MEQIKSDAPASTKKVVKDQNWIYDATDEQLIQELTPNEDASNIQMLIRLFMGCSLCACAGKWGGDILLALAVILPLLVVVMWLFLEKDEQFVKQAHQRAVLQELQRRARQKSSPAS